MKEKINKRIIFEILAIVLIAIFCISLTPKTLQNDTFYTIKIGEHIIQEKGIDMIDPFSWHENLEYTYPHWLYDVIIYGIYSLGGMTGIYISTCIFAIILGITVYIVNSKLARNQVVSFFITIGVMYMLKDYITARAQLVTFILFILQIFAIEKLIETKQKRYGLALIIISILVANLHVAVWPFTFVLYLPYIAEYIIAILEEKTAKKFGKEIKQGEKILTEKKDGVKLLVIVMIICILTGLLTPLGTTPYTYLVKTMQGNTTDNINEHQPLILINDSAVISAIIILLAILIFTKVKIRLSDLIMLGGLTLLMFYSKRQSTIWVLVGGIILNKLIYSLLEKDADKKAINSIISKFGIFALIVVMLSASFYLIRPKLKTQYIDESLYPVQMSEFILNYFEENNIDISTVRLYKDIPVFIDSRADLYAPEFNGGRDIFTDFIESSNLSVYFGDIFEKYDITHVILYKNSKINMIITETNLRGYKLIKADDNFVFYEIVK